MSKPDAESLPPVAIVVFTGTSGLTHYAWSLARALSARRRVELLAGEGCLEAGYPPLACAVLSFFGRTRRYPLDLARLFARLLHRRGQLVLVQGLLKNAVVEGLMYRLLRLAGVRVAMTVHDALPHYPTRWSRATHRWLYTGVDHLVVHAERTRADLRALGVVRPMAVIPHGAYDIFDTEALQPAAARRRYSTFGPDDFVLLFFGRIDRRKGVDAFLRLREQLPSSAGWRFVIAGRNGVGRDEAELATMLERARQDPHCLVRDDDVPFAEVQRYFRIADAVVLPYREGTTSGVLKLAMAFGLPVVATDVGDLGEALRADPLGVLASAHDESADLPAAVTQLRERMPAYLQAARETRARYSWESIGGQYDSMLRALSPDGVRTG